MNVFKLFKCDIQEGILKNKRFIMIPFLCIFQCIYAEINIINYKGYYDIHSQTSFFDLLLEIFRGCDPISNNMGSDIRIEMPYFWLAFFIFCIFTGFDYMRNDLTHFGIQVISRTKKRRSWWISKCLWCLSSSIFFYVIFILITLIFSILSGYKLGLPSNPEIMNALASRSFVYTFTGISETSVILGIKIIIAPLVVLCTLNMIQMLMSLFIKPMFSYLILIGVLIAGVLTDSFISFARYAMVGFSNSFFKDGYQLETGLVICSIIIIVSILVGIVYIKKYDIIPDKE